MNCDKTISPNSLHTHNNSPRYKTRNSSIPLLSPRSNTRHPPILGPNPTHMTKTSTHICTLPNPPIHQPRLNLNPINFIHYNWRLRRTKPNPTTKNHSLLINCPHRLNNSNFTIQPHHNTIKPNYLYYHDLHYIFTIHS